MTSSRLLIGVVCLVGVLLLLLTAIPAPFTIDDCNYLSSVVGLRHGTLFVPGTEGLPPSAALYAYEPMAFNLKDPSSPVPPAVPPLYALIAYPFSFLGWHGLVLLNLLSALATAILVYTAARRLANQVRAGWYAAVLWLLGASTVEYAQGLWPHMLSVALVTAGVFLVAAAIVSGRSRQAVFAGFMLGFSAGVRYQNAVMLLCGLVALLIWGARRWRAGVAFLAGSFLPIVTSALFNHARIHSWNPFSKGLHYIGVRGGPEGGESSPVSGFFLTLWTRIFDFSAQPPFYDRAKTYLIKLASGDIVTNWGVLKKSWMQGSPWILFGFVVILLAWARRDFLSTEARSQIRKMALPLAALLAVFGLAGVYRHDGMSFNQRYLLELAPLMAIAVAVSLSPQPLRWTWLASGLALGLCAVAIVLEFEGLLGYRLQSIVPLILGGVAACLGVVSFSRPRWLGPAGLAVAMCLAWSFTLHLSTDLQGSRRARKGNQRRMEFVAPAIPSTSPTAVLSVLGAHDGFCPMILDRDVVVVTANDVPIDELPPVLDALLAKRRVFVWLGNMPATILSRLQANYRMDIIRPPRLAEITKIPTY